MPDSRNKTRGDLINISLRLRSADVRRARELASRLAIPYQHVIRGWVADAAEATKKRMAR